MFDTRDKSDEYTSVTSYKDAADYHHGLFCYLNDYSALSETQNFCNKQSLIIIKKERFILLELIKQGENIQAHVNIQACFKKEKTKDGKVLSPSHITLLLDDNRGVIHVYS